jgi:hypothetical protein
MMSFELFPAEILLQILKFLSKSELLSAAKASRKVSEIALKLIYENIDLDDPKSLLVIAALPNLRARVFSLKLSSLPEKDRNSKSLGNTFAKLFVDDKATSISRLDLAFCKGISNQVMTAVAPKLTKLQYLNISGSCRTDSCLIRILRSCGASLRELNISWNCQVTDAAMLFIGRYCPNLITLDISGCSFSDVGVVCLSKSLIKDHVDACSVIKQ